MKYLGMDVHSKATAWCLLDERGQVSGQGRVATTVAGLSTLVRELGGGEGLLAAQEVGTQAYFIHDIMASCGVKLLSFNAQQFRMIAASRKKTDRRDAWWLARALQTGMYPEPVYLPTGRIRQLRSLLSQRDAVLGERRRWVIRARANLRAAGHAAAVSRTTFPRALEELLERREGLETHLHDALSLCQRQVVSLSRELGRLEAILREEAAALEDVVRLMTIPGVGRTTALVIFASVGEVGRFPNARKLCAYAGLVPTVHQSGQCARNGHITKQGSSRLRSVLVQASHVVYGRSRSPDSEPLRESIERVHTRSQRKKIALVAGARHLLRIAFYVLRDKEPYDAERLRKRVAEADGSAQAAA